MSSSIKEKADNAGVSGMMYTAGKSIGKYGQKAADVAVSTGSSIVSSAQDGTLKEKSANTAYKAGSMLGGFGQALYKGA